MNNLKCVKEIAEKLGVGKTTVYKLVADKKIPHVNIGGRYMFREESVNEWLAAQEVKPTTEQTETIAA